MSVELRITFDGTEPGLREHRLSLAAFAEPLRLLLLALQRTGSAIVSSALDDPSYGRRGGKLAKDASLLDLELVTIGEGSAAPSFLAVARTDPTNPPSPLYSDLPARAVERLVRDIEAEAKGVLQNASVRRYLASLPAGVESQRYTARRDGTVFADAELGRATLPEVPRELPKLIQLRGSVIAVGFDPGTPFVSLRQDRRTLRCSATKELVDLAVSLRGGDVEATLLDSSEPRLLALRSAEGPSERRPLEATLALMDARWGQTLARLAQ